MAETSKVITVNTGKEKKSRVGVEVIHVLKKYMMEHPNKRVCMNQQADGNSFETYETGGITT